MLEEVEGRVIRGGKRKEEVGEEGELSRGEIKKVLKTMKNGKAWRYTKCRGRYGSMQERG